MGLDRDGRGDEALLGMRLLRARAQRLAVLLVARPTDAVTLRALQKFVPDARSTRAAVRRAGLRPEDMEREVGS